MVALYRIDCQAKTAEFGRLLLGEKAYRRKGYAEDGCRLLLRYAFSSLKLEEVYLDVYDRNEAAIALYERLGFVTTGFDLQKDDNGIAERRRRMILRNGRAADSLLRKS
jgi:RimJ/RimL family protein N-acetyltransferase